jgi:uncharacterized protein YdhG (YjbR/CyaY superfamily)
MSRRPASGHPASCGFAGIRGHGDSWHRRLEQVSRCGPYLSLTVPDWVNRELDRFLQALAAKMTRMAVRSIDEYLVALDQPTRKTLEELRRTIVGIIPDAEECISYGMPAFRLQGKVIAGFAAFENHLSYLPHSGSVLAELSNDLAGYKSTQGSLHFAIHKPLPKALVKKLIAVRLNEVRRKATARSPAD